MGVASSAVPSSVRGECCAGFWILSLCFSEILSSPFGSLAFSLLVFQCIKSLHIGTVVFHPAYNFSFSVQVFFLPGSQRGPTRIIYPVSMPGPDPVNFFLQLAVC